MKVFIIIGLFIGVISACRDNFPDYCSMFPKIECHYDMHMRNVCQKYCGLCQIPNRGCVDENPYCHEMYPKVFCRYDWMVRKECKKFCGLCDKPKTTSAPETTKPTKQPATTPTQSTPPIPTPTNGGNNGQCGVPRVAMSRVIGGEKAAQGSWPWQVGLYAMGQFGCGGSLINTKWVLTAAHCVDNVYSTQLTIRLGDHDRRENEGNEQNIKVKRIIMHRNYYEVDHDIALLELSRPALLNKYVQPVCLPAKGESPAVGSQCFVTGWGKTHHRGDASVTLMQAGLKVTSTRDCQNFNRQLGEVTEKMICGHNGRSSEQSGCHGDSGGPFVCKQNNGSWKLHGVVSWGSSTCSPQVSHSVFTRVSEYRDWIDNNIN